MKRSHQEIAAYLLAGCAVVLTITLLYRTGSPLAAPHRPDPPVVIEDISGWDRLAEVGHTIGPDNAPLRVIMFSDFECPACRQFASETFPNLMREYPEKVALTYRHFPLQQHRFAYHAAKAAECAAAQGAFATFYDVIFANQDSLGLKNLRELALEARIPDAQAFDLCLWSDAPVAAIERDVEAARQLGAIGTPTIIMNGTLFRWPDRSLIDSVARAKLKP
jgi:protein-disulfide isomerase